MLRVKPEIVKDADFHYYNKFSKEELIQKLKNVNKALRDKIMENSQLRAKENSLPINIDLSCDVCGNHPNTIFTTPFGRFCQQHARFI